MGEKRLRIIIHGAVQGMGFRPTVHRLACTGGLRGWVSNAAHGLVIEVEGPLTRCKDFYREVQEQRPVQAVIQSIETFWLDPKGYQGFEIRQSTQGEPETLILPDLAMCPDCRREIFDPSNRRFRYPFTNCTQCGPRYSIIHRLPYDRGNTTMRNFQMCASCEAEYHDPGNRRFHAQPNACPDCGPHLELWDAKGRTISSCDQAMTMAVGHVRNGAVVAVKGLGGFHLICDARNAEAVCRLRERKNREAKPFAVMMPDMDCVLRYCEVSELERQSLLSAASPIVLLLKQDQKSLAQNIAPGNPFLGVMLPYSPLHALLLSDLGFPVVATSGNLAQEPLCVDEEEARKRLDGIADWFLVHNREIARPVDDSIARVVLGREMILRRARGYAPLPFFLPGEERCPDLMSVGGHLKNTVAFLKGKNIFISQHIGDLETPGSQNVFEQTIRDIKDIYAIHPQQIVCDAHPGYVSAQYARSLEKDVFEVQHHEAHVWSVMMDNDLEPPVFGVSWDGTGYGEDRTVWGGEFFSVTDAGAARVAGFETFPLPGAEKAVVEPRRSALGFLFAQYGARVFQDNPFGILDRFSPEEIKNLKMMLRNRINSPLTSSVGRIFDAAAALLGLRSVLQFEAQAAMDVEFAAHGYQTEEAYTFDINPDARGVLRVKIALADGFAQDIKDGISIGGICAKLHTTFGRVIVALAGRQEHRRVVLSGGCFQNVYLLKNTVRQLEAAGFCPYWHQRVPTNDGGLSLGQIGAALARLRRSAGVTI